MPKQCRTSFASASGLCVFRSKPEAQAKDRGEERLAFVRAFLRSALPVPRPAKVTAVAYQNRRPCVKIRP